MKNLFAYTEPEMNPGYISINSESGVISITVRSQGKDGSDGSVGVIEMTPEQVESMCSDVMSGMSDVG